RDVTGEVVADGENGVAAKIFISRGGTRDDSVGASVLPCARESKCQDDGLALNESSLDEFVDMDGTRGTRLSPIEGGRSDRSGRTVRPVSFVALTVFLKCGRNDIGRCSLGFGRGIAIDARVKN